MQKGPHTGNVISSETLYAAATAAFVVFIDRYTKIFFASRIAEGEVRSLMTGVLDLVSHHNFGIVANVPLPQPVTIFLTFIVMGLILLGIQKASREKDNRSAIALGLIFAGALGNLFDRVMQGYVFDWILLFSRSAINLSDISIVAGTLWYLLRQEKTRSRNAA